MEGITATVTIETHLFYTNTTIQPDEIFNETFNETTTSVYTMDTNSTSFVSVFHHNPLPTTTSTSSYDCELYEFIVVGVVNVMIVAFGLVGNTLVKTTLWNERGKSPTSFLLIVLAFADDMVLIVGGFMMFGLK